MKAKTVSFYLEDKILKQLDEYVKTVKYATRSKVINEIITEWLDNNFNNEQE